MHIPPRRIVGLIVIGLLAGALAKLFQRAVLLRGGALATFEVGGERFRAWTTNPQSIHDLHRLGQGTSTVSIPNGRVLRGPEGPDTLLPTTGTWIPGYNHGRDCDRAL